MVHCWTARHEAEGFTTCTDWFFAHDDKGEEVQWEDGNAICLLEDGHEGPHEFTPESDIAVEFH